MSASDRLRPNHVKYQVRNAPTTNNTARIRIGPDARTRCAAAALLNSGALLSASIGYVSRGRVEMVKHQVDDHTGNRNIQPNRQCPPCDSFVFDEVRSPGAIKGD